MKKSLLPLIPVALSLLGACGAPSKDASPKAPDVEATAPGSSVPLEGTEWLLVDLGGKPAIAGVGTRKASLSFTGDSGSLRGNSGLNSFFGPYALDGSKLRIENLAMTRMAGPPELMEQEGAFVATLCVARSWRVEGDVLVLVDEKGATLATLRAGGP
ncbi:MAG: META domain-containing protein [Planctomycetota bacterium]|nr:META domain-containing protein [Planctomycetota bacterium]